MGNIGIRGTCRRNCTVHPHVCGEHIYPLPERERKIGSSPRMWGTSKAYPSAVTEVRFIPTYVGNILHSPLKRIANTVHPHVCGEHEKRAPVVCRVVGSSPRMWGTLRTEHGKTEVFRFIPTYVGNILHVICLHFTQEIISISFIDAGNPLT